MKTAAIYSLLLCFMAIIGCNEETAANGQASDTSLNVDSLVRIIMNDNEDHHDYGQEQVMTYDDTFTAFVHPELLPGEKLLIDIRIASGESLSAEEFDAAVREEFEEFKKADASARLGLYSYDKNGVPVPNARPVFVKAKE